MGVATVKRAGCLLFAALAMWNAESADAEPTYSAFVHTRVGQAAAPFFLDAVPRVESEFTQAISFVVGGEVLLERRIAVGFELPAAPSLVAEPAGSYVDNKAFGNPQLVVARVFRPFEQRGVRWRPRATAKLGLPLAGHGPASTVTRNRVVAISAAVDGWRNQELYVPGVVPITAAAQVYADRGRWRGAAEFELPVLVRIHDADTGAANTRAVAVTPNLTLRGGIAVGDWLELSVASHFAALVPAPVEQPGGALQASLEPRIVFSIDQDLASVDLAFTIDALVAVGGPLSGTAGVGLGIVVRH